MAGLGTGGNLGGMNAGGMAGSVEGGGGGDNSSRYGGAKPAYTQAKKKPTWMTTGSENDTPVERPPLTPVAALTAMAAKPLATTSAPLDWSTLASVTPAGRQRAAATAPLGARQKAAQVIASGYGF